MLVGTARTALSAGQASFVRRCRVFGVGTTSAASHAPSVVAAYQQATEATPSRAVAEIYKAGDLRAFFRGLPARTLSLAGTFTVVPLALDWFAVQ